MLDCAGVLSPVRFLFMTQTFLTLSTSLWLFTLALTPAIFAADRVYQTPEAFIDQVFAGKPPKARFVWLTGQRKEQISNILGHAPDVLRLRYWLAGSRSVWILEEIGKEKPITTGVIVDNNKLAKVKVLIFRESRGWEVKRKAFTDQYKGSVLTEDLQLDLPIDGISGATLSVSAVTRLSRLALYLHGQVISTQPPKVAK